MVVGWGPSLEKYARPLHRQGPHEMEKRFHTERQACCGASQPRFTVKMPAQCFAACQCRPRPQWAHLLQLGVLTSSWRSRDAHSVLSYDKRKEMWDEAIQSLKVALAILNQQVLAGA